jgi:hypothetical protein
MWDISQLQLVSNRIIRDFMRMRAWKTVDPDLFAIETMIGAIIATSSATVKSVARQKSQHNTGW